MIFVHDKGRMANNMLQYGHVYAWGREYGRKTMSMRFAYKYPWFHICDTPYHNFLTYVFAKYAAKWKLIPIVRFNEEGADYTQEEQLMLNKKLIVAAGWEARWYDLFLKYKQEIIDLFAFKPSVMKACEPVLTETAKDGCRLGVHIRRGDYATWYDGKYFFSDEVFIRIIKQFIDQYPNTTVYICGNDPSLNKDFYQKELKGTKIIFPKGNAAEDLYVLSECNYLIGPPSTFSLTASMYHDTPLYWIKDTETPLTEASFGHFDELFQHIL